ncbi:MAG: hypothetical protein AAGH15_11515 [Myxococcota bacterium]
MDAQATTRALQAIRKDSRKARLPGVRKDPKDASVRALLALLSGESSDEDDTADEE